MCIFIWENYVESVKILPFFDINIYDGNCLRLLPQWVETADRISFSSLIVHVW